MNIIFFSLEVYISYSSTMNCREQGEVSISTPAWIFFILWQIMSYHKKWSSDIDFWSTPKNNVNFLCCFCTRPWKKNSLKNKLLGGIQCLVLDFDFIFYDICKKHYHPLMIPIHFSFKITFLSGIKFINYFKEMKEFISAEL